MRALEWLHRKLGVIGVEFVAVEKEGLRPAECHTQVIDKFERRRLAEIIVEPLYSSQIVDSICVVVQFLARAHSRIAVIYLQ